MDIYSNSYKYSAGTITYYITLLGYWVWVMDYKL
jgi:hypothetical protein